MLLNLSQIEVDKNKITEYLLNTAHPDGGPKAQFFLQCGFTKDRWTTLADALKRHASVHAVAKEEKTLFGTKYVIEGILETTTHRRPLIRSVWFLKEHEKKIKLVTAYPILL